MNEKPSHIKDRHGHDFFFCNAGDVWFSPSPLIRDYREHMKQLRHLELSHDDIVLASFPRSGTHWHHQILCMLMHGSADYVGALMADHLEWSPLEKLPPPDKSRLLVSHLRPQYLPQQVREKKVKVIYCYRNPKDTWVSNYNFAHNIQLVPPYQGPWNHFFDLMMEVGFWYGDWFNHVLDWEREAENNPGRILLSSFEDLKMAPVDRIMKINQFLGLNRGRALCEQIAKACHFPNLKAVKDDQIPQEIKEMAWRNGAPGIFRKGEVGDWRNWFTVEQNERFDAAFERRMSESKLPFIFR